MNDTNIDTQSESILLQRAREFKAADEGASKLTIYFYGVEANIVIFIFISL